MKQNNDNSSNHKQYQLKKIKQTLIKQYQIYDTWLLEKLATTLLENGINIDKFNNPYLSKELELDEIVNYLQNKILIEKEFKIINKKTTIIDFKSKKKSRIKIRK